MVQTYKVTQAPKKRDYSLTGESTKWAIENGLASADWCEINVPRKTMKALMRRKNGPAIRDTLIWFLLLGATGYLAWLSWGSWWSIPAFMVYGISYASCGDARWHECSHGTAFRTRWLNDVIYHLASFTMLRNGTLWRWQHARHHTDTLIVGRDPEIAIPRPPPFGRILANLLYLHEGGRQLARMARHIFGTLSEDEKDFVPESERWKVVLEARIQFILLAAVAFWCFSIGSIMPALFIGLPTFYGAWLSIVVLDLTQHTGLAENVLDHRKNCRTMRINPVLRFIYWNMHYHTEHHMFPNVPYHALPKLYEEVKNDMPAPYPSLWAAWKEMLITMWRQRRDLNYYAKRPVPGEQQP